jgi:ribosome-associated protein
LNSQTQALIALDAALSKKALEPVLLDVTGQASYTDFILLVSGNSDRHVQAIADAIVEAFARERRRPIGVEGTKEGRWSLIDFGDVVVHVFYHPLRDFYDLEGLWCDAPRVAIDVPPDARAGQMY